MIMRALVLVSLLAFGTAAQALTCRDVERFARAAMTARQDGPSEDYFLRLLRREIQDDETRALAGLIMKGAYQYPLVESAFETIEGYGQVWYEWCRQERDVNA